MIVLWLLGGFLAVGFSYDEIGFGDTYRIRLPSKTQSIEFTSVNGRDVTTLWNRDEPLNSDRYEVVGSYFSIEKVNRRDRGTYRMKDKDQNELSTKTLDVSVKRRSNRITVGRNFDFTYDLEPASCNIYFIPDYGYKTEIVRKGELLAYIHQNCDGLEYLYPCGISKSYIQTSCSGSFEIRDEQGNVFSVETVEVELEEEFDTTFIGVGFGFAFILISFCCCIMRCVYQKSPFRKDMSESPDEAPTVHHHQYNSEPVGPRPDQLSRPSETLYPTVPSYNPSAPLIHNPPSVSVPPAYSEIHNLPSVSLPPAYSESAGLSYSVAPAPKPSYEPMNPSEPAASSSGPPAAPPRDHGDAPASTFGSDCLSSDPELRYELKGLTAASAPPLNSDSTLAYVYTSDKLNF